MKVHNISTKALEKIDDILFKSMLQLVERQLSAAWNLTDNSADIVLVDVEQPAGKAFWETPHPDTLVIAYAKTNFCKAEWFLQKPLRVQPLVQLLNTITALQMNTRKAAEVQEVTQSQSLTAQDKTLEPLASSPQQLFEPNQYLLGLLQEALHSGQAKRFSCAGLPLLYILPFERQCFTSAIHSNQISSSQKMLYGAFAEHIDSTNLSSQALLDEVHANDLTAYPIETLLWLTTLYASHGRLVSEYTQQSFIRLKQWPNFAILPHHPLHMNLAAFMLKKASDLPTVANKTQIPLATVIDFFNACTMIGLIVEESNSQSIADKNIPEPKRHLFKNILKRLLE